MQIGVPKVVTPSGANPDNTSHVSVSFLGVVILLWPGRLRSSSRCISSYINLWTMMSQLPLTKRVLWVSIWAECSRSQNVLTNKLFKSKSTWVIWSLGGTPSTIQPTAPPWLSPKVVTRKLCPNVFPAARVTLYFLDTDLRDFMTRNGEFCSEAFDISPVFQTRLSGQNDKAASR